MPATTETPQEKQNRVRDETSDYVTANDAVIGAEQNLPKWRRYPTTPTN
jgi:hypothetical protein